MAIECPRCSSYNAAGALHCDQCGAPLGAGGGGASRRRGALGPIALIFVAAAIIFVVSDRRNGGGAGPSDPRGNGAANGGRDDRSGSAVPLLDDTPEPIDLGDREGTPGQIVAGWMQLEDPHGQVLERVPTAVTRAGWCALPRRVALGADRFVFRPGQGGETPVIDGIGRGDEAAALWRIESPDLGTAPRLVPWEEGTAVTFVSYSGNRTEELVPPPRLTREGYFLRGDVWEDFGRGGVLLHESDIVGWITGEPAAGIWLWAGDVGDRLEPERTVAQYYTESFAGGREEALAAAHALASSEAPRVRVLLAFGDALRLRPRLSLGESRERWLPPGAVPPILRAMRTLLDDGAPQSILASIDERTLEVLADPGVLLLHADAVAAVDGPELAIALLDRWAPRWIPPGSELDESLQARWLRLFIEAVTLALDDGDLARAWAYLEDGRRRFPNDPELYLIEVELWVDEGDWRTAESLLSAVSFPPQFRERVARLERRISELKGAEGRIVIRFRPGAPSITTHADVGGTSQLFIVDTGASYTSIPWSTVRALGIRIDERTPRRQLRTASDVVSAPVVVLPTITLGGWTVENVEATVLDLPGSDEIGLLGLNFLGSFRVDLDREQGMLTLEPK